LLIAKELLISYRNSVNIFGTVWLSGVLWMSETPMMRQYKKIKRRNPDCILFFRLGDFYEMFGDDAVIAAKELDLVLTSRSKNVPEDERIPMCGIPYHAAESYISRMVAKGYKIAICEQMEDPKLAKGLVKRDIVRIITPGTAIESSMLEDSKNNFICAVYISGQMTSAVSKDSDPDSAGVCFCDLSTGEAYCAEFAGDKAVDQLINELGRFAPAEALLNVVAMQESKVVGFLRDKLGCMVEELPQSTPTGDDVWELVEKQFGKENPLIQNGRRLSCAANACAALLQYLYETQKTDLSHIRSLTYNDQEMFMELDYTARRNLELCETIRTGEKKGSLLWVLDKTRTPMGGRLIRSWLEKPLTNPAAINKRLTAVEELLQDHILRDKIVDELKGISDMERIIGRVVYGSANCRDLRALSDAAKHIPVIRELLQDTKSAALSEVSRQADPLMDITELLDSAIVDDPPFSVREGGFIKSGYNADIDKLREVLSGGRGSIASFEADERERTGIKSLKVGYNRVFGYYIEVRKSGYDQIPEHYIRKQTLVDRERYITEELKELETTILTASERVTALEYELFTELRTLVANQLQRIQQTAHAIAQLDVFCSFAESAYRGHYCRPDVDDSDRIEITDGRHPVVERMLADGLFVPNDVNMDCSDNMVSIITGPNMAGKSTYMRQVALIVLMAQAGSFVPAKSARIGAVDRIFTRIGASDDLASGQSTFMVEMSEVADILRNATSKSLLILDEIGRGTSTFDGMAIARAVLEWVSNTKRLGAKTLFATHYHELTDLENQIRGVKNYNIAVKKRGSEIIFLRKIVPGGTDQSYGIEVARLAGLPDGLIKRANEILQSLEKGELKAPMKDRMREADKAESDSAQISLLDMSANEVVETLKKVEPDTLTPIEALNLVYKLKKKIQ
jgi:DNA mismatch repair protein MutS